MSDKDTGNKSRIKFLMQKMTQMERQLNATRGVISNTFRILGDLEVKIDSVKNALVEKKHISVEDVNAHWDKIKGYRIINVGVYEAGDLVSADIKLLEDGNPVEGFPTDTVGFVLGRDFLKLDETILKKDISQKSYKTTVEYPADYSITVLAEKKIDIEVEIKTVKRKIEEEK